MAENNPLCITHHYDVLRLVFRFLCAQDLDACSKVCEEWKEVVTTTFKRRRLIQAFAFKHGTETPFILNRALLTIVIDTAPNYDYGQTLYISDELIHIPLKNGRFFIYNGSDEFYWDPNEGCYSGVLRFPPHDQTLIKTINFDSGITLTEDEMPEKFGIPVDTPIKAVIMKVYVDCFPVEDNFNKATLVMNYIKRLNECAFAGTVITHRPSDVRSLAFSITVFAGKNVEAGSCILNAEPNENNIKIQKFSKRVTKLDNSVIIMFRSHIQYIPTLRTCFPTSFIFSCDGFLEIGDNYPIDIPANKKIRLSVGPVGNGFYTSALLYLGLKD